MADITRTVTQTISKVRVYNSRTEVNEDVEVITTSAKEKDVAKAAESISPVFKYLAVLSQTTRRAKVTISLEAAMEYGKVEEIIE